ncbi:phage antirepressor N-terminal domain-containing protein [Paradesertivirga mongoliensis]|uniref:Phage antirepressor N-terminal domain-containing protein n=1 Tax=Paradesertivirga mongoliensis TaxID=2100740 RepID=A0ABW4ZPZ7_9SPHI|nr:phage antirepressor N-terminal domain-containing protein [Pedobacter mongoliensis]
MNENNLKSAKSLATVNGISILLIDNSEKLIPIKPICQALGIDEEAQRQKIQDDDDLGSTALLSKAVAADGKERDMYCLPLKFIFGWLFTINPKNVREEAREAVKKYRKECYEVLYKHFTEYSDFVIERGNKTDHYLDKYREAQVAFKTAKDTMEKSRKELDEVRRTSFDQWKANGNQIKIDFDNPTKD